MTRRIKQLGRQGRPKEAIRELASLSKLGLQPDTTAATALVDACSLRDVELAQSVFDELFGERGGAPGWWRWCCAGGPAGWGSARAWVPPRMHARPRAVRCRA